MDNATIIQRYEALWSQRKTAEQTWQWIERYVVPFRGKFFRPQESEHEIEWSQRLIYDSTAVDACDTLAASLHGSLTSPQAQWFHLKFRSPELNEVVAARAWLEEAAKVIYDALQDSNFGLEINELYIDLCSFGTGVIIEEIEQTDAGEFTSLNFHAVPIREAYFEEDWRGQIKRFYRRHQWTALQIIDKFGADNVPDMVREKAKSAAQIDTRMDVIFCIYEREEFQTDRPISSPIAAKRRPWGFKFILKEGLDTLGDEGGYYEMPAFLPRWKKVSGSQWGHSPAHICLPSILQLNQVLDIFTSAAEKALDPPMLTEMRNVFGDINLDAENVTTVRDIDKIKPLVPETRMDMVQFQISELRQMIRSAFRVDQLELKESPAMTATEVMARVELMNRLLGPTMGRLQSDLFDKLISRTFNVLMREGRMPPPPQEVIDADAEMDVDYRGPLARAQKSDEAAAAEQFIASVLGLAEIDPSVVDILNLDEYARETAEMRQVPATLLRDQAEVDEVRAERAAAEQAAQMAQTAQMAGEGMKAVGEGIDTLSSAAAAGPAPEAAAGVAEAA